MDEYVPRHASTEVEPELYWQQVYEQDFRPLREDIRRGRPYTGRHRNPDGDPDSSAYIVPVADTGYIDARDLYKPDVAQDEQPQLTRAATGANLLEEDAVGQEADIAPKPKSLKERLRRGRAALYAASAATYSYFNHPEKGRRRQVVAVLAGYLVIGAAAWLASQQGGNENYPDQGITVPDPGDKDIPPHISEPPDTPPTPPEQPPDIQDWSAFYDSLEPAGYNGEQFEWSAMANQSGAENATPQLLDMIGQAESMGAQAETWGDPSCGHWGITSVSVKISEGEYRAYYDTPHKLAILQYLSKLNQINDKDDDLGTVY